MDGSNEQFTGIPDKYYTNEMRREVTALAQGDFDAELATAHEFIDIGAAAKMIAAGTAAGPETYTQVIRDNQGVRDGLWKLLEHGINQAREERGYDRHDPRGTVVALCSAGVRVARVLDIVKMNAVGSDTSAHFINAFTTTLISDAARGLIATNADSFGRELSDFTRTISDQAFSKISYAPNLESWSWAKVHVAAEAITNCLVLRDVLAGLPEISAPDVEMLKRQNEAMGQSAQALRTYGPKPAVGRLESTDIRSLFIDREVVNGTLLGRNSAADMTAVQLYPGVDITSSNARFEFASSYQNRGGHSKRIVVEDLDHNEAHHTDVIIYKSARITFLGAYLEDFADSLGLGAQATLLTSMLLAQNFDLTVPAYIVALADEEATRIESEPGQPQLVDKLRRLLLARTRALNVLGPDINQALQDEDGQQTGQHRDMAKHDVIDHLRRLPPGYSASPKARALCLEEFGQEIPEGHTYVRRHNRGNIDVPHKGHRMVKNPRAANIGRVTLSHN